ncbi:MAG: hypothetical protein KBD24_03550 [Candidatus Pacebacteria bacterium]|nr:hypothetical protein [Candidatus Paceibacterota bacterium]
MDEETTDLLKENIRLTRENNRLLHKLWRAEIWRFWSKLLVLIIMIGVPVLVYRYYLADVVEELWHTYQGVLQGVENIRQIPEQVSLSAVLESLEKKREELMP